MTQVIETIGGEYRNRTGVHGFASCQPRPTYQRVRVKPEAQKGRNVRGNVKPDIARRGSGRVLPFHLFPRCPELYVHGMFIFPGFPVIQ